MRKLIFDLKTQIGARSSRVLARELRANEQLSPTELEALSMTRAASHARYAMTHSPFYRRFYADHGFTLADLDDPASFTSLPIVDKQMVRDHFDAIRTPEATTKTSALSTSGGSTGEPLRLLRDLRAPVRAVEWRLFRWWGINPWDDRGDLYRQTLHGSAKLRHDLQWWPSKRLHLNARSMSDDAIRAFVGEWNDARPALLLGYVGGVLELCRAVERLGLRMKPPKAVALTAAPLPDQVRAEIEATLGAPAHDHYRASEMPWMAGECRAHSGLHVFADVRRIEVLDPWGAPAPVGVNGEVVATDMTNRVFPLIRYRLGDITSRIDGVCPCGVNLPRIAPVAGRVSDVLRLPDGSVIAGESLTGLFSPTPTAVRQFQLIQAPDHSIVLRCIVGSSANAEQEIRDAVEVLRDLVRASVAVRFELVQEIPHVAGKTQFIISDVRG